MIKTLSYRQALMAAISFHLLIAILLMIESTSSRYVLTPATKTEASAAEPLAMQQEEPIKAVSVSSEEVTKTVNRLKNERLHQQQTEDNRQRALAQQAAAARQQRIQEQQHLQKLKNEAATLAVAREKKMVEEQEHLKQLQKEKEAQEKSIAEMKNVQLKLQKEQQQAAEKLVALKKKKAEELAREMQANMMKANAMKAQEALAQKQQAEAVQQAAVTAQNNAQMAGEVDKYKALIINSISRQWILPENANGNLSSQFRIRLAPNGAVLDVSLTRSSGDAILDRSAQSAIYKASPLPVPNDPATFNLFRDISLTVRPENARG